MTLLLGTTTDTTAQVIGRWCGVALLTIAAAWWPARGSAAVPVQVFYSALIYNALIALFLASVSIVRHMGGLALWAAVALHAILAVLLVTTWQGQQYRKKATGS